MASLWNTNGYPAAATTMDGDDAFAALINGVNSAASRYSGSSDPSTAAPVAWGVAEVGRTWYDTTDTSNPVEKQWRLLAAAGPTYGWWTARRWKTKWLTAPEAITFSPASPAAANVAASDCSLATLLNTAGVQDTSQTEGKVRGVWMRVRVRTGASETITAATDHAYFQVKEKGSTLVQQLYCQIANRYVETTWFVPLDTSEIFQFLVTVGGGTAAFEYEAWVLGFVEAG